MTFKSETAANGVKQNITKTTHNNCAMLSNFK